MHGSLAAVLAAAVLLAVCRADSCPPQPAVVTAYQLSSSDKIVIDGKLDDPAWQEVAFSTPFVDIQGPPFPTPRFLTQMKLRWDDTFLYVGGYVVETQVWANETQHDSVVFMDNDFEMFIDPDASTHYYKEFEINAINTVWDLMLNKPYLDGGGANDSWDMMGVMQTAIYVEGAVNDPSGAPDAYWTVELALPLAAYVEMCFRARAPPQDGDSWRINFSRVEWHVEVVDGQYEKVPNTVEDNWVWQPQDVINMHLPERWGYLYFSTAPVNTSAPFVDPEWPQRAALAQMYYAEHQFQAVTGYYTDDLGQLVQYGLPDWVWDGSCGTAVPVVSLPTTWSFSVAINSTSPGAQTGFIRDDRLTWFGNPTPPEPSAAARAPRRASRVH